MDSESERRLLRAEQARILPAARAANQVFQGDFVPVVILSLEGDLHTEMLQKGYEVNELLFWMEVFHE